MSTSYWDGNRNSDVMNALNALVPGSGSVNDIKKNPKLEEFRIAANLYHEIFNNGCMNYSKGCMKYFGITGHEVKRLCGAFNWEKIKKEIDPKMDVIVLAAAIEQNIPVALNTLDV